MQTHRILGLMSGTSLDGLDIAYCVFVEQNNSWTWSLEQTKTIAYPHILKNVMEEVFHGNAYEYAQLHTDFGRYMGEQINLFLDQNNIPKNSIDLISSHGHTIFHQPNLGFTSQIGCGATIAAITGIKTVCDFRTTDVAKGGQGAPLVPMGDQMLFSGYDAFLNLGGFANISFQSGNKLSSTIVSANKHIAFDICPVNFVFNHYCAQIGKMYDEGGNIAKKGKIDQNVLKQLNGLEFYNQNTQKSLGREWVNKHILPILDPVENVETILATYLQHVTTQIGLVLNKYALSSVFVTGGGAFNTYLMQEIQKNTTSTIHIPDQQVVNFKEALIFAFLGLLRDQNKVNTLASVTGARQNSVSGAVYLP